MDIDKLQRRVNWTTGFALVIFSVVILAYVVKIYWLSGGSLAGTSDVWGQFGDYVGGLLNPLIAFLAFYWLTQSVLLQKQELAETKDALKETAASQSEQVNLAALSARINGLSALLASYNSDLSSYRNDAHFIASQLRQASSIDIAFAPSGKTLSYQAAIEEADQIDQRLREVFHERQ